MSTELRPKTGSHSTLKGRCIGPLQEQCVCHQLSITPPRERLSRPPGDAVRPYRHAGWVPVRQLELFRLAGLSYP